MKFKEVNVSDLRGLRVAGRLIVCDACESETFHVFVISEHSHLQCTGCGKSFCDGKCADLLS